METHEERMRRLEARAIVDRIMIGKEIKNAVLILITCITIFIFLVGFSRVYEEVVRETVCQMVKPEHLIVPCKK